MGLRSEDSSLQGVVNDVLIGNGGYLFLLQGAQRQFVFLLGTGSPTKELASSFL